MLFATLAAITYGILHDQVTAHLCVEYFSIAHPPVFPTESPFLLALGWGIIATWWVGLPLGIGLAAAARLGKRPKLGIKALWKPIVLLMLGSAAAATLSGVTGAVLFANGLTPVPGGWDTVIPPAKHVAFTADAWAHSASYGFGLIGGLFLIVQTFHRRRALTPSA
ncbi:hypothetical protein [Sphingomonas sp. dw_22]|uniref:hypothetical protein n=1 Tax=Sphingomonas sp. dw_22 TaxID=2721175 RepID=UPI001BD64621|nr:hypothetical protein [Sphingomonas sp. dw_22]